MNDDRVVVYQYGCPHWVDLDEAAMRQLRLAHELRNALVEIERRHAGRVAEVWAAHPDVAAADVEVARLEAIPDVDTRELRAARRARREAKAAAYPVMQPAMVAARKTRRAEIKGLYRTVVQRDGLFWATYNDVVSHHEAAVARIARDRKAGRPAELRFRRWDGTGTLTVQLQREDGKPRRSPELLASGGGPWRNVARLEPWIDPARWDGLSRGERRRAGRGVVVARCGRDAHIVLPVQVHRPLPPDADVTQVQVSRRRVAGRYRVTVQVTARLPQPTTRELGPTVGVNIGWRSLGDRGLRVATVESTAPLPPPPRRLDGIVSVSGRHAEVVMPDGWRDVWARTDAVRSRRDLAVDVLRGQVIAALPVAGVDVTAGDVARWRSPRRFARLAASWPAGHPLAGVLEAWRRHDRHLWEWEANERDQIVARRRDAWRCVAAWLCASAAVVAVESTDVAELSAARPGDDPQTVRARAQRQVAAPGELRESIVAAAVARGVRVARVDPAGVTVTHAACGETLADRSAPARRVMVHCETCGVDYDQDVNAARLIAARAAVGA